MPSDPHKCIFIFIYLVQDANTDGLGWYCVSEEVRELKVIKIHGFILDLKKVDDLLGTCSR